MSCQFLRLWLWNKCRVEMPSSWGVYHSPCWGGTTVLQPIGKFLPQWS